VGYFFSENRENEGWLINARSPRPGKVTSDFLPWLPWTLAAYKRDGGNLLDS
jgi:hypothetical protein